MAGLGRRIGQSEILIDRGGKDTVGGVSSYSLPISQDMARSAKLRLTFQVFLSSRAYVGKMLWYSSLLILDIIGAGGLIIGVIVLLHRASSRRAERF